MAIRVLRERDGLQFTSQWPSTGGIEAASSVQWWQSLAVYGPAAGTAATHAVTPQQDHFCGITWPMAWSNSPLLILTHFITWLYS